ncbi:MAG: YHYH protein [Rhizobiaceae bacterium]|nr:YHYH protein [Rhizobiaceae bacterium]
MHRISRILAGAGAAIAAFAVTVAGALAHDVDLTRLPVGDGRVSSSPQAGWVWACRVNPQGGGAHQQGPWFNGDGTYDLTAKAIVPGNVMWNPKFSITEQGDSRVFSTNDLPNHGTGVYPIGRNTDAYKYDRNPNSISEQNISFTVPANPALASPGCAPGAVGVLISGSVLFNPLDEPGRDAVAWETQDRCQGHPQMTGVYHYHSVSTCVDTETLANGHSALVGYAIDGFGIFGRKGVGGETLVSADLDECHGHTHEIEWDGRTVDMYHYHATWDFPYTIGCLRGSYDASVARLLGGGGTGGRAGATRPNQPPRRQAPPPRRP